MRNVAGVDVQHVQLRPPLPQPLRQFALLRDIAGVAQQQQRLARQCLARRVQGALAAPGDRHRRALGDELAGGFQPDAAGAAGNQCVFALQS